MGDETIPAKLDVPDTLRHLPWLIVCRGRIDYGAWTLEAATYAVGYYGSRFTRGGTVLAQPAITGVPVYH